MITAKWKKKQILINYGFTSEEEVANQIRRFVNVEDLIKYIKIDGSYYSIKLVPIDLKPNLKNYIIDETNMTEFLERLKTDNDFSELWCCKNENDTVFGRFSVNDYCQSLELVRGINTRLINKIPNVGEYISAKRISWGWRYNVEVKGSIVFQTCACRIEENRDRIEQFFQMIYSYGISSMSIEFRMYNEKIVFIDWDTSDDALVIRKMWGLS